ncbi:MAG: hypothetical protein KKD73_13610 [Proteobacteria bacterium]|nr:hypothetical protein [Pseudomonadota bacterium]MBU1640455.1 hypothetical protein [Pseudomonadota bacterium]
MNERRNTQRIKAQEDIFVQVNDCLCKVHDISLDGIAFDYQVKPDTHINGTATLEIFFMSGPILYIENIPYTIVADIPLLEKNGRSAVMHRRACTRFDDLNFRQIVSFNHLMADHLLG